MKKYLIVIGSIFASLSFLAFSCMEENTLATDPALQNFSQTVALQSEVEEDEPPAALDLAYKVGNRFNNTVTKARVDQAATVIDLLPEYGAREWKAFQNVGVTVTQGDQEIQEMGEGKLLTAAQLGLLRTTTYSTEMVVSGDCQRRNSVTNQWENTSFAYSMTVIPTQEAEYAEGQDALMDYLKTHTKEAVAIIEEDQLKPGRVRFLVTKEGTIAKVRLDATSGYPSVDDTLVQLMTQLPGDWQAATNAMGEEVDQEMVFFFGLIGC